MVEKKDEEDVEEKDLPGFEEVGDPEVERIARRYKKQSKAWVEAQKPAFKTEEELIAAVAQSPAIMAAAKKNPEGKVKVGGVLLTIPKEKPKIKVKILKEEEDD